jgi:hypothetical protein
MNTNTLNNDEIEKFLTDIASKTISDRLSWNKSSNFFHTFKKWWHEHKYLRLIGWVTLWVWAILAWSAWAVWLATWMLATRAIISAVGWYLSMDAMFDIIRSKMTKNEFEKFLIKLETADKLEDLKNEIDSLKNAYSNESKEGFENEMKSSNKRNENYKKTKVAASIITWIWLWALWSAKAVNALENMPISTREMFSSKINDAIWDSNMPISKPTFDINEIFADIQNDHPSQWYVTLEQTVRRIEWLKVWIPLEESEKLKNLNINISKMVSDPSWKISEAAKELWILGKWQNINDIATKLTKEKIIQIIKVAYPDNPKLSTLLDENMMHPDLEKTIPDSSLLSYLKDDYKTTISDIKKIWAWVAAIAWWLLLGKKVMESYKDRSRYNYDCPVEPMPSGKKDVPREPLITKIANRAKNIEHVMGIRTNDVRQTPANPTGEKLLIQHLPLKSENAPKFQPDSDNTFVSWFKENISSEKVKIIPSFKEKVEIIASVPPRMFWFTLKSWSIDEAEEEYKVLFTKETIGWLFALSIDGNDTKQTITIHWFDDGINKHSETLDIFSIYKNKEELELKAFEKMEKLFMNALVKRDEIKNGEYAEWFKNVEISSGDLDKIFEQLDEPYVRDNWFETGWYWFQDIYNFKNNTLRMKNLQNPIINKDIKVTWWSITILWDINDPEQFMNRNMQYAFENSFDVFERRYLVKLSEWQPERLSGKAFFFNWHKHPNYPFTPSSMDIGRNWETKFFRHYSPLPFITFWIVVEKKAYLATYWNLMPNAIEIKGNSLPWKSEYVMSYWKVKRRPWTLDYGKEDLFPVNIKLID